MSLWIAFGAFSSILLAYVEVLITAFIQLLLKVLGLVDVSFKGLSLLSDLNPSPLQLGIAIIAIGALRAVAQVSFRLSSLSVVQLLNARLRLMILHEMLLDPDGKYVSVSKVNTRIGETFSKAVDFITACSRALGSALQVFLLSTYLLYLDWKLSLVGLSGVSIVGLAVQVINRYIHSIAKQTPRQQASLIAGIERVSKNWLLVKVLRTGKSEFDKLSESVLRYASLVIRASLMVAVGSALPTFLGTILVMLVIVAAMNFFGTAGGMLITFLYIFLRFLQNLGLFVGEVSAAYSNYPQFKITFDHYLETKSAERLSAAEAIENISVFGKLRNSSGAVTPKGRHSISTENANPPVVKVSTLSFSHPDSGGSLLEDLSFTIESGEQFGIVGKSGTGKSTLLGLILGILEPQKGSITINNSKASEFFKAPQIRIGYVGPDPYLIAGTVRDNIQYGATKKVSDNECWDALQKAQLIDLIAAKKEGLDFVIPENLGNLSAGQKQRLVLARALAANPQLLVLDEATCNLDKETEQLIVHAVSNLRKSATVIVISHRDSALTHADRVLKLGGIGATSPIVPRSVWKKKFPDQKEA